MSLTEIKDKRSQGGFTIVELLIVIVIIAVLAAIVVVAYNGLTNRAKASKASGLASSVMKKLEAYNAEVGTFPSSLTPITSSANTSASYYMSSADLQTTASATTAPTAANGETTVQVAACTSGTPVTYNGYRISYWDYNNNRATTASTTPASYVAGNC
jgi:prepilin-type N-terminal cleavage/methylation domain-containing protein